MFPGKPRGSSNRCGCLLWVVGIDATTEVGSRPWELVKNVQNSAELADLRQADSSPFKGRRASDPRIYGRSKLTNHVDLLPGVSGNDPKARRFRDLVLAFVDQLGGLDQVAAIKLGIVRQLAALTVKAEEIAAAMMKGEKIDVGELCTLSSTCLRLSVRLGLEHIKPLTPGLHDRGGLLDQMAQERAVNPHIGGGNGSIHDEDDAA
jgi:hypothetical protein